MPSPDPESNDRADSEAKPAAKGVWEKFDIFSRTALALVGIVVSVWGSCFALSFEERQRESQARREIERSGVQRKLAEAQLASGLVPQLAAADPAARQLALQILGTVAPELAADLLAEPAPSQTVSAIPQSTAGAGGGAGGGASAQGTIPAEPADLEELTKVVNRAVDRRGIELRLTASEAYLRYDLPAQAARELFDAVRTIPPGLAPRLDQELVAEAQRDYDQNRYRAAADKLRSALEPLAAGGR